MEFSGGNIAELTFSINYMYYGVNQKKMLCAPHFLVAHAQTSKNQNCFSSNFHFFNFQNVISDRLIYEFYFDWNMLEPYARVIVDINAFIQIVLERAEFVPISRQVILLANDRIGYTYVFCTIFSI